MLVRLRASPQAKKKWSELPEQFEARLLTRTVNGKERQVLTSLTDPLRFPASELMELYQNRWEIELGYREMKQATAPADAAQQETRWSKAGAMGFGIGL